MASLMAIAGAACGRQAVLTADALPVKRVVIYRNGVAYFERAGHVEDDEVRFKMKESEVGDFLATLAVIERGGSSVKSAAFPLDIDGDASAVRPDKSEPRGLKTVVLSLDGKVHDLQVGYVAESPVWRPSYRLVVHPNGQADLQAWGIVQNLSGEDWKNVRLSLVAGAPLAFEAQLGTPTIPPRPIVTDNGEVIASVPKSETTLQQEAPPPPVPPPPPAPASAAAPRAEPMEEADEEKQEAPARSRRGAPAKPVSKKAMDSATLAAGNVRQISAPRNVRSLAAVAAEAGTTRYDLPVDVTVPDKSATMVMLLSRTVPGEAIHLFAPDGGVPDSANHPFRVARFSNRTGGALERGPIAVFEEGSFLGQGMVEPLPNGAFAAVPFALERSVAIDQEQKFDELGARVAKIENGELTVECDASNQTKYRLRNGAERLAKIMVKHPRRPGTRLFHPPKGTEDNVGTGSALVPIQLGAHSTGELLVDERLTVRRAQDWFAPVADNAVKEYLADPRADRAVAAKLSGAWAVRREILAKADARTKFGQESTDLSQQTEETRRNLRAIEKNRNAEALRSKLTARLGEMAARLDEITKRTVEIDAKLAELRVQFREAVREIRVAEALPPRG